MNGLTTTAKIETLINIFLVEFVSVMSNNHLSQNSYMTFPMLSYLTQYEFIYISYLKQSNFSLTIPLQCFWEAILTFWYAWLSWAKLSYAELS